MSMSKRRLAAVATAVLAALVLAVPIGSATARTLAAAPERHADTNRWSAAWAAAQQPATNISFGGPNWSVGGFTGETVRQIVRVTTGGSHVRIRLSNRYGSKPLQITGATIAKRETGAKVKPEAIRPLTFEHGPSTTIPVGAETASDAVQLPTSPLESLTVTMYFAESTGPATFHGNALSTSYKATGDHRFDHGDEAFTSRTSYAWYFLTGVDVTGGEPTTGGTVVAFGDSITDGYGSRPDTDNRYPDELAERLVANGTPRAVANSGISGGRLLGDSLCFGQEGVTRHQWDVLDQPNVSTAIILLGLNDIGTSGSPDVGCGLPLVVTPEQVIEGHRTLIEQAHARGLTVIGATFTPMKGSRYHSPEKEAIRDAVNEWILNSGEYDHVFDVAKLLADPADADAMNPAYDSGDHLHPNDAGRAVIAEAIDLDWL
ncbi:MAG TPA: SGNH/GDSL hydrolase family protein [Kribbella sp.]|nr:SGNH/GDSL hydrolase family protein [Kribbella sp.]